METLPGIWGLTPYGALLGVLVLIFWLTSTGRYIPRSSHERELAAERSRGDEWKSIAEKAQDVVAEQSGQITSLLEVGRTVEALVRSAGPQLEGASKLGGEQ